MAHTFQPWTFLELTCTWCEEPNGPAPAHLQAGTVACWHLWTFRSAPPFCLPWASATRSSLLQLCRMSDKSYELVFLPWK